MNQLIEWISQPWPWYVAGPMIGLTVPALLILGNKTFGISSSLRHVCAACVPAGIPFFTYDWKKEIWNLLFVLGTAMWGWTVSKSESFRLLEAFEEWGGLIVDSATNYPINGDATSNGKSLEWVSEWFCSNPKTKLKVLIKIGSKNNSGSSESDLSKSRLLREFAKQQDTFSPGRLFGLGIHWDNRPDKSGAQSEMVESLDAMRVIANSGLEIGISGLQRPDLYKQLAPDLADKWIIQVKENILDNASRRRDYEFFPKCRILAYGLNMGGLRLERVTGQSSRVMAAPSISQSTIDKLEQLLAESQLSAVKPNTLNELGLWHAFQQDTLTGVILGPSSQRQLMDSTKFIDLLRSSHSQQPITAQTGAADDPGIKDLRYPC
jgi:aryl-alcohol dehydrogenase-like predicted oxidoreductase